MAADAACELTIKYAVLGQPSATVLKLRIRPTDSIPGDYILVLFGSRVNVAHSYRICRAFCETKRLMFQDMQYNY